jgi:hypothetical protein
VFKINSFGCKFVSKREFEHTAVASTDDNMKKTCANKLQKASKEQKTDELDEHQLIGAIVAEWLRRLTRNQFPFGSVGSNPTDCDIF